MRQEGLTEGLEVDLRELRKKHEPEYDPVVAAADAASKEVAELGLGR